MQKLAALFLAFILFFQNAISQNQDKNVIIQESTEEYRFVKGNKTSPVQIKQELENVYSCDEFRTGLISFYKTILFC